MSQISEGDSSGDMADGANTAVARGACEEAGRQAPPDGALPLAVGVRANARAARRAVLAALGGLAGVGMMLRGAPVEAQPTRRGPMEALTAADSIDGSPAQRPGSRAWSEHDIATPDGLLHYAALGEGPVLVVVPGGPGGSGYGLRSWFEPLARSHTVVVVDNIGRGRSARLARASDYTLARDARDLEAVRRHLGRRTLAVYGHSYGGLVAQAYALAHPQRVSRLVLGNTLHGAGSWQRQIDSFKQWLSLHHPEAWSKWQMLRSQGVASGSPELQQLLGPLFKPLYWADRNPSRQRQTRSTDPRDAFNPEVYRALIGPDPEWQVEGSLRGVELLGQLARLSLPALVLAGRYDPVAPPVVAQQMHQALRRSQLRVFEHSAHRPAIEEPAAWQAVLAEFLA